MANIANPNLEVFGNIKTVSDFQRLYDEFALKKQLAQAQIQKALKPDPLDITKMGQEVLVKRQMGLPTTPQEDAIANVYNATTEGIYTDLYGNAVNKPGIIQRLGALANQPPGVTGSPRPASPIAPTRNVELGGNIDRTGAFGNALTSPIDADTVFNPAPGANPSAPPVSNIPPNAGMDDAPNEWDLEYQKQRAKLLAEGDRRSVQALDITYAKSKMEMNDQQSKDATYADRMRSAAPKLEQYKDAAMDTAKNRIDRNLPDWISNPIVGSDFQANKQAQRDFLNAVLRKESGAVISPTEFSEGAKQYFPQPGDQPDVLQQKAIARQNALSGISRAAGPAYKAAVVPNVAPPISKSDALNELKRRRNGKI